MNTKERQEVGRKLLWEFIDKINQLEDAVVLESITSYLVNGVVNILMIQNNLSFKDAAYKCIDNVIKVNSMAEKEGIDNFVISPKLNS